MQRPRRTTEYETPSAASRQSRPSRLQQPVRRPSVREGSLTRSSSVEPINHLTVPSTIKRQRSSSVSNARTPQRTPTHITPSKVSQFTGEKQRPPINDKRWMQEQVAKISDYLKTVDSGVSIDFLNRGGLKTMSIKQFIGLVNYFLKFVAGNKFTVGSNHVESISKILNQIDYPYTVNKSWLKTPAAPHAFGNAVMLFSYFMEFIPPADNLESFKTNYLIKSDEFPDMDFAFKLSTMAEEGFALWNNQKDVEFEKLQQAAVDQLIYKKVQIAGSDALNEEIKRLNSELDKIISNKAVIEDEDEYFRLDKEVKTNQRKIAKLRHARQENQKILQKLKSQVNIQLDEIAKIESRIDEIRNVVETQEVTIDKRNKLIVDVDQMKYILKMKKQAVCDLQKMDYESQVLLSRHMKQLTEKISKFNSYIRQIMSDFKDLDVDIEILCLHQNTEMEPQINKSEIFLKKLQEHITNRMQELSKRSEAIEAQIKLISYEISEWIEPKINEMADCIREQQRRVDELDREEIAVQNYITNRVDEFTQKLKRSNSSIDALKKAIQEKREEVPKTQEENEVMMKLVQQRFEEMFTIRRSQLKRFQEVLQEFQKKCADAKSLMMKGDHNMC